MSLRIVSFEFFSAPGRCHNVLAWREVKVVDAMQDIGQQLARLTIHFLGLQELGGLGIGGHVCAHECLLVLGHVCFQLLLGEILALERAVNRGRCRDCGTGSQVHAADGESGIQREACGIANHNQPGPD